MTNKDKLIAFIDDLNTLTKTDALFGNNSLGIFELKIIYKEEIDTLCVGLFFVELNIRHCIYFKRFRTGYEDYDHFFSDVYLEILLQGICSKDSVGKMIDSDNAINVLCFNTLLTEGLKKIREYKS